MLLSNKGRCRFVLGASVQGFFYGRPRSTWPTLLAAARGIVSLGFGVELWPCREEGEPDLDRDTIAALRAACRKAPFVSLHSRSEHWAWDPDGLRREITLSRALGAQALVLHPGSLGLIEQGSRPDFPEIRRLAQEAREAGVRLALENGKDSQWALDWVLEEIGDDPVMTNLGICIDIGHAHLSKSGGRDPVRHYLERYRASLVHLHVHDNVGEVDEHRLPGEGTIDWRAVLATLEKIGYAGPAVFELHPEGELLPAFARARSFLEGLWEEA